MKLTDKELQIKAQYWPIYGDDLAHVWALYRHLVDSLQNVEPGTPVHTHFFTEATRLRSYACVLHKAARIDDSLLAFRFTTPDVDFAKYLHAEMRYAVSNFDLYLFTGGHGYIPSKLEVVLLPKPETNLQAFQDWIEDHMDQRVATYPRQPKEVYGLFDDRVAVYLAGIEESVVVADHTTQTSE